jgi:hypothetical protein
MKQSCHPRVLGHRKHVEKRKTKQNYVTLKEVDKDQRYALISQHGQQNEWMKCKQGKHKTSELKDDKYQTKKTKDTNPKIPGLLHSSEKKSKNYEKLSMTRIKKYDKNPPPNDQFYYPPQACSLFPRQTDASPTPSQIGLPVPPPKPPPLMVQKKHPGPCYE